MLKKLFERLRHKYGPLPLWAWALIIGGGIALYLRSRAGREAPAGAIAEPSYAYAGGEPEYGDTGASSAALPAGEEPAAADGGELSARVGDLWGHVTELEDAFTAAGYTKNEDKSYSPPGGGFSDVGGEEVGEPDTGASSSTKGVGWFGRTFTTKAGLGRALAAHGSYGQTNAAGAYAAWAKRHPQAAKKLGGSVPKKQGKKGKAGPPRGHSPAAPARGAPKHGAGHSGARPRSSSAPKKKALPARPRHAPRKAPPRGRGGGPRRSA